MLFINHLGALWFFWFACPSRSPDRFNAFAGALSMGGSVDDSLCDSSVRRYDIVHKPDRSFSNISCRS